MYYASNCKILQMQAIDELLQMSILNKDVSVFSSKKVLNMVLKIIWKVPLAITDSQAEQSVYFKAFHHIEVTMLQEKSTWI